MNSLNSFNYLLSDKLRLNMSMTFSFSGKTSELSANLPTIPLEEDADYVLGLTSFEAFNSIPNVDTHNNKFYYYDPEIKEYNRIEIPTGSYEIMDINKYLRMKLGIITRQASDGPKPRKHKPILKIEANNNTLRCEIKSTLEIDFTKKDSIGPLLGFKPRKLKAQGNHQSDNTIDVLKINTICIDCNIVTGSYHNDKLIHRIHQFFPTVPPGYKIVETPATIVYLPINTKVIDHLAVKILDQDGNLVNFRGETVTVRLHLKKVS